VTRALYNDAPACAYGGGTADVLAGVEVRVSTFVDGVPLATRCRLAAASNSPTGGVLLVTAAEFAVMRDAFAAPARPSCPSCGAVLTEDSDGNCLVCAAPAHNPGARVVATGGGR